MVTFRSLVIRQKIYVDTYPLFKRWSPLLQIG